MSTARNENNNTKIDDRFYSGNENRNFEDFVRGPNSFGRDGMIDRFGSSEDKDEKIVFPDGPILKGNEARKPVDESKIEDKIAFPSDRSKSDVTDRMHTGEGVINLR